MPQFITRAYGDARREASDETGHPIATFAKMPTPEFQRLVDAALTGEDFTI